MRVPNIANPDIPQTVRVSDYLESKIHAFLSTLYNLHICGDTRGTLESAKRPFCHFRR